MSSSIIQQKTPIIQANSYDIGIRGVYMSDKPTFGDWLKQKRESLKISGAELERRSKVSRQYISNLERNLKSDTTGEIVQPSVEYVDKLANGLGVDINEARLVAGYAPVDGELSKTVAGGIARGLKKIPSEHRERAVKQVKDLIKSYHPDDDWDFDYTGED